MASNNERVLAEVLSIDAWHEPLRCDGKTSAVHVELSFRNGRLGGDDKSFPFTFDLYLKRAVLTIRLEKPLELDRQSVARNIPKDNSEYTMVTGLKNKVQASAAFKGKLSPSSISASLDGSVSADNEATQEEKLKVIQRFPRIIATPRPGGSHEYSWCLEPFHEDYLTGQPWDPTEDPRLSVKSLGRILAIEPAIKVVVSCSLDDIHIDNLQLKNRTILNVAEDLIFGTVNEKAAIQHLKHVLKDMQLEAGLLEDRFSEMNIADILSVTQ
ncbi:hypothetical protein [Sphingomonas sp. MMS24-J13]|uniref:hypothetical protein n=1 Tax=Sphingomonas sp. MMS24-J13 TaxID=3238686 RepID=UPI00384EA551